MPNQSLTFNFHNNQIRIIEQDGEPWFVAVDVCRVLGMDAAKGTTQWLRYLDASERNTLKNYQGIRGNPNTAIISESGLYKLIMRSNKAEAKSFQDWVTKEVLPAIRKTGSYAAAPAAPAIEDKATNKYAKHPNFVLASELAAKAAQAVFEGVLCHGENWLRNQRLVMSCLVGRTRPSIKPVPHDAYIASMARFTQMVDEGVFLNVSDLAKLAAACNARLAKCMS